MKASMLRPLVLGRGSGGTGVCHSEGAITPQQVSDALPRGAATVSDIHTHSAQADRGVPHGGTAHAERDRGV
ncbi:hypothetical protein GCM10009549_02600 [Streptomyces thermoalcalitolerans]|uniref:Uncharacterized protein n=1 Tax=Streptomyces thermoalcalitolerans TaxID=65605 RepID=A0ABN1ND56_9ACTN